MNWIRGIDNKSLAHSLAAILLGFAFLTSAAGASSDDAVVRKTPGGVSYVSGGAGTDSIDRLNTLAGKFVATFAGHAVKRQVAVGGAKLRTVDFRWVSE